MTTTIMGSQDTVTLTYGTDFTTDGGRLAILAPLFGHMVKVSQPIIKGYHSDLFHDAEWIRQWVNGPTEFYWLVREHGTHIGETAIMAERQSGREPRVLFHVAITRGRLDRWEATFTEVVRVEDGAPFSIGQAVKMFPDIAGVITGESDGRYIVTTGGTEHKVSASALLPAEGN